MNKILITQGGQFKSVIDDAGIRDSWDFVEAMKVTESAELYAKVSAVYRAANLTADAVSNIPFAVMQGENDIDTSAKWKNKIRIMPNPRELLRLWTLSLFFHNAAYGRIAKTNSIKRRLFYVMPQNIEIVTSHKTGEVVELQRTVNGIVADRYNPSDYKSFVYCWHLDHTTELLPSKNTDFLAMSQAAGVLYSADFWTQNYFKHGAVRPTIVSIKGLAAGDKKDELQSNWSKFVRSIGTRFSELAKVINGDAMDVKSFGDGLGDIKDSPVYKQAIENIAMASGMPLSLLLANSANYATAQTEYANWFRDKITPKAFEIQEWLNEQIFQPAGYYFEFRPEQSEPSQQEEVERANAYGTYVNSGMLPSIAAQIVGLDLPAGIEYEDLDPDEEETKPAETVPNVEANPAQPAEAQPAQEPDEMETDMEDAPTKSLTFEAWQELDIWKRKATKAAKHGEALPIDFICNHIPADIAGDIRAALVLGEVRGAFEMNRDNAPIVLSDVEELQNDLLKVDSGEAIKLLADAINAATAAALQTTC